MLSLFVASWMSVAHAHTESPEVAVEAPEVVVGDVAELPVVAPAVHRAAETRFDQGAKSIRTSQHLLWGGSALVGGGIGALLVGGAAAFGGAEWGVPVALGGLAVAGGGTVAVVTSPFVAGRGLHLERQALAELEVQADQRNRKLAVGTGVGGAVVGVAFPPALYGAAVSAVSFSVAQHRVNERALATVNVSPQVAPQQVGVRLHGSF